MQITDEGLHRTLKYVVAVCDAGYPGLSAAEIEAFSQDKALDSLPALETFARVAAAFSTPRTHVERLQRIGWVSVHPIRPTPLGRAVLRALELDEARLGGSAEVAEVLLDSDDELVLSRLVGELAEIGEYLLIDPYLRVDTLPVLLRRTEVRRALVSDRLSKRDQVMLADYVDRLTDGQVEVRITSADQIHDRYVVSENAVIQLGTSMNGVGKTTTVLAKLRDVGDAIRGLYEQKWAEARQLSGDAAGSDSAGSPDENG